jgi:peptidoglycan/LPS O-acetylase OafA/YrhL
VRRFFELDLLDNRYPALHGMRVLAIVSVVQFHVTTILAFEYGVAFDRDWVTTSLTVFFGMDLFFVLSGFLIGSILLHSIEVPGKHKIRRFYLRRVFRTFPSYWVTLTVLSVTMAFAGTLTPTLRRHLPFEYGYLTNFLAPIRKDVVMVWGWSLALEEQFYLVVPLLFFVLRRLRTDRMRIALLCVMWACGLAMRLIVFLRYRPWTDTELYHALYFRTYTRFDTLVAGIVLAFVHARYRDVIARWLEHPFHRALLALPSLTCLWVLLRPWIFGEKNMQVVHVFAWGSVTSIMYFGWTLLLLHGTGGWIHRSLSRPVFRRLATLGYGIYLVHIPMCDHVVVPAARALIARHAPLWLLWPVSLATALVTSAALAYAMHLLIEKPSLWVRDKIAG